MGQAELLLIRAYVPLLTSNLQWTNKNLQGMVLFYCTFVAMKRQDSQPIPDGELLEDGELEGPDMKNPNTDEFQEYGGVFHEGDMLHALRLFRDSPSGVVRLEGSACRGPMSNVPLWTAFVTHYAHDPDHVNFEGNGVVSFAAMKPPPYVFLAGYKVPRNANGEYSFQFENDVGKMLALFHPAFWATRVSLAKRDA